MIDLKKEFEKEMGNDFMGEVLFGEILSKHSGLATGGPADIFVNPSDAMSLKKCIMFASGKRIPVEILGGGTNVLMNDRGFRGMVITLKNFNMIKVINETSEKVELFVEAGMPLQRLLNRCAEKGYKGLECLAGIPGTVGGAIICNSGSFGQEIKDVIDSVVVISMSGMIKKIDRSSIPFTYRASGLDKGLIVLSANITLERADPQEIRRSISDYLARKKVAQPIGARSAGCVFRNPDGDYAGRLIEEAGCKGLKVGGMEVSSVHANYIVNTGEGTSDDFIELMKKVEQKVLESAGIKLEPEVRILGDGTKK